VGRWEPNARGRLEEAALDLYVERGYEGTTVAEIAQRAGLTERTYFRYFADKREVLFGGSAELQQLLVSGVHQAAASVAPLDAVARALEPVVDLLEARGDQARRRQTVIDAQPELQERELAKLATLATAMAATLRERGVEEPAASLSAEAGIAVFKVAFERWIEDPAHQDLSALLHASFDELRSVAART
jgi:AcrR family transcriptional regulator